MRRREVRPGDRIRQCRQYRHVRSLVGLVAMYWLCLRLGHWPMHCQHDGDGDRGIIAACTPWAAHVLLVPAVGHDDVPTLDTADHPMPMLRWRSPVNLTPETLPLARLIHIPKTAGTAIQKILNDSGMRNCNRQKVGPDKDRDGLPFVSTEKNPKSI